MKCCFGGCFFLGAVLSLTLGGIQADHSLNAAAINSDFADLTGYDNAYDSCQVGGNPDLFADLTSVA